jgi:hypothetical protein
MEDPRPRSRFDEKARSDGRGDGGDDDDEVEQWRALQNRAIR